MNAMNTLNGMKQTVSTFWGERNKREQNMLAAGIAVIVFGLFYSLLIDPALSGRKDLEKKLPALREQAAEVQALAKDAAVLGSKAAAPVSAMTRESLESSLNAKGLKPQSVVLAGDIAKVQLNGASFSSLIDWLNEMRKSARLSVTDASIEAQAQQADIVNANLSLRQQKSEQQQ